VTSGQRRSEGRGGAGQDAPGGEEHEGTVAEEERLAGGLWSLKLKEERLGGRTSGSIFSQNGKL
jgi:hypothetical protein